VAIASGLKDTSMYAANPNGLDRSFTIDGLDSIVEGSTVANRFQYVVYNGSPNSLDISLNKLSSTSSFVSGLAYGDVSNLLSDNANFVFNVSNANKTEYNGAYAFQVGGSNLNQTGVVFTSGFYRANGNPAGAPSFKILVALNDGTVRELTRLSNKLQVIHNSPDTTIRSVDVFANGVKFISGLKFRKATGITATDAYVPVRLNITKAGALDTNNSLWAASLLPDSNFNIAIAHGFTGAAYRPNPNSVATNFGVTLVSPAKSSSTLPSPTNEVSFFHGSPNMGKVTIQGEQEGLFIARDNIYRSLYKYSPTKGNAAAQYFITNVIATGSPVSTYKANFVGRSGLAGIMFSSGLSLNVTIGSTTRTFYDSLQNKNVTITSLLAWNKADSALFAVDSNLRLGYYIAWSNGMVDTLERVRENVGLNEVITKNNSFVMYPNPATDKVTVAFTASQKESLTVNIIDIRGALVKTVNIMPVIGENKVEIETENLTKGIYFIQLTGLAGFTTQKLIIE
jgi:Secretion system C-terminal sorting domain